MSRHEQFHRRSRPCNLNMPCPAQNCGGSALQFRLIEGPFGNIADKGLDKETGAHGLLGDIDGMRRIKHQRKKNDVRRARASAQSGQRTVYIGIERKNSTAKAGWPFAV